MEDLMPKNTSVKPRPVAMCDVCHKPVSKKAFGRDQPRHLACDVAVSRSTIRRLQNHLRRWPHDALTVGLRKAVLDLRPGLLTRLLRGDERPD